MTPNSPEYFNFLFVFYVSSQELYDGSCFFFPPKTFWTPCGTARRPLWAVEQFWCSYPLNGPRDPFLLLWSPREIAKPLREKDECAEQIYPLNSCVCVYIYVCVYEIYICAVAISGRLQFSLHFFSFSLNSINIVQPGFTCNGVPQTSNWLNPTLNEGLQHVGKK